MPRVGEFAWVDEKQNIRYRLVSDFAPIINNNDDCQKDGTNGFTEGRSLRHVGSIPAPAYHRWAKQIGYYEMDRHQKRMAMYKFLADHPEYRAVDALKHETANQTHLIVK